MKPRLWTYLLNVNTTFFMLTQACLNSLSLRWLTRLLNANKKRDKVRISGEKLKLFSYQPSRFPLSFWLNLAPLLCVRILDVSFNMIGKGHGIMGSKGILLMDYLVKGQQNCYYQKRTPNGPKEDATITIHHHTLRELFTLNCFQQ